MTDANTMKSAVAAIVKEKLAQLEPLKSGGNKFADPAHNTHRQAILETETELRKLITGGEIETHEWLAVIHYALAEERERLL